MSAYPNLLQRSEQKIAGKHFEWLQGAWPENGPKGDRKQKAQLGEGSQLGFMTVQN